MIKQALFHQPWITGEEPDDPQIEINECVTSQIKDMPKETIDFLNGCKGSRRTTQKRFNIKNKEK